MSWQRSFLRRCVDDGSAPCNEAFDLILEGLSLSDTFYATPYVEWITDYLIILAHTSPSPTKEKCWKLVREIMSMYDYSSSELVPATEEIKDKIVSLPLFQELMKELENDDY